jgi:hypothetical protein
MQKITSFVLVVIALLVGVVAFKPTAPATVTVPTGAIEQAMVYQTSVSSSTVQAVVTKVLSTNTGRIGFRMTNTGGFPEHCTLNSTSTTANLQVTGITLNTSSTGQTTFDSREARIDYLGDVYCAAPNGTSTMALTEYLDR